MDQTFSEDQTVGVMQEDYGNHVTSGSLISCNEEEKKEKIVPLDNGKAISTERELLKSNAAAAAKSPSSPRLYASENSADSVQQVTNSTNSSKSGSPTADFNGDYSSVSSFSTLASSSKLSGEDIDFVKFYFENCRSPTQLVGNTIYDISEPVSISRILDCSPIHNINFDDTAVNFSTPVAHFSNQKTGIASTQFVLESFTPIKKVIETNVDDSSTSLNYSELSTVSLQAPVNSPNSAAAALEIPISSTPICGHRPDVSTGVDQSNMLGASFTENSSDQDFADKISPEILQQQLKCNARPPCIGQEHSPESDELSFLGCNPVAAKMSQIAREPQMVCRASTETLNSDIDLAEVNPPLPILMNSARKVGSWLRRLQEDAELSEYSEDTLVDQSTADKGTKTQIIPRVVGLDKSIFDAPPTSKCKRRSARINQSSMNANAAMLSSNANCHFTSPLKKCYVGSTKQSDGNCVASLRPGGVTQVAGKHCCAHRELASRRPFRRSRMRSYNRDTNTESDHARVSEDEVQQSGKLRLCQRDAPHLPSSLSSHARGAKQLHFGVGDVASSDDQNLPNSSNIDKRLAKRDPMTVFPMACLTKPSMKTVASGINHKRLLARKLKAIGLYIRHKKVTHLKFKTLAIV